MELRTMNKISRNASFNLTGGQSDKISEAKTRFIRDVIMITNTNAAGGASCYISIGEEAAANKGIQLAAGQSINFSKDSGYTPSSDAVHAYAAAAGTTLAIYEELREVA
jgi:hypothetical protein